MFYNVFKFVKKNKNKNKINVFWGPWPPWAPQGSQGNPGEPQGAPAPAG